MGSEKEKRVMSLVGRSWFNQLKEEFDKPYFDKINQVLSTESYLPQKHNVLRAFMTTSYDDTRVVMLGQDPYHDGTAMGLCFATEKKLTPTLRQILPAMDKDLGLGDYLAHGTNLSYLADRGVFMLNTSLTVRPKTPGSHLEMWKPFTEKVMSVLGQKRSPIIFLLWGSFAKSYRKYIDESIHKVVEAEHPVAAAYRGETWDCKQSFSKARDFVFEHYNQKRLW